MPLPKTLKHRLIVLLLLSSLFPVVLIGSISYSSMYAMLKNKADKGIASNLHLVRLSFENTLSQLNRASQQLVFEGETGSKLDTYLSTDNLTMKRQLGTQIMNEMSLIHFTNPTLGVIFYYLADTKEVIFQNSQLVPDFDLFKLPVLAEQLSMTYYGPHTSINPLDGNRVLSVIRKVNIPARDDVYLYIETDFKLTDRILNTDDIYRETFHLFVDQNGTIAYSEKQDEFRTGGTLPQLSGARGESGGYYLFEEISNQSWRVVAAVPKRSYNQEIVRWIVQFAVIAVLSIGIGSLLALAIWRMVYKPLLHLQRNIRRLKNNHLSELKGYDREPLLEFAEIHQQFASMRDRINELILDIDRNARSKRRLEVENLLYKINPHFIHNTLDTIRWLARVNGHHETDRLVSTLNKLLYYNLGKGRSASIRDEIEALKHYVLLQGVRYNFHFEVRYQAAPRLLELPVPRFILQPLVENSITHGLRNKGGDQGVIEVAVIEEDGGRVRIEVRDNGYGMTEAEVERMLSGGGEQTSRTGLGIGWQYVRRMLELQFGGKADMRVQSGPRTGTTITLLMPVVGEKEDNHAESDGRG